MSVFKSPAMDEEFQRYGYVVVNLLDDLQVQALRAIHHHHPPPESKRGFVMSALVDDHAYKHAVDREIKAVLGGAVADIMPDQRIFHTGFALKKPRMPSGAVALHQDPALVDEHKHTIFIIWCPLVEVDASNGWLGVVAGSHHFNRGFRSTGMPYPELHELLRERLLTFLPVRPGQVVFLNPRTLHCSPINRTNELRLVAAGTITDRSCDEFYYCYHVRSQGEHMIEVYEVEDDFLLHHVLGTRPTHGRLHSVLSAPPEPLDARRLLDVCAHLVRQPTDSAIVDGLSARAGVTREIPTEPHDSLFAH